MYASVVDIVINATISSNNQSRRSLTKPRFFALRGDVKIPHRRMTKTCWGTLVTCFEMYETSHTRPFVPSVGGIGLLCKV